MNVILILLDSLNRHYLECYGNDWVKTPNISRLAQKGIVYDNHFIGSAPCIPARRDLLTGRREFMWRGWGQTEPFDRTLAAEAKKAGAWSAMITDHYHYWNRNDGYGYTKDFDYCDMIRGAEADNRGGVPTGEVPLWAEAVAEYRGGAAMESMLRNLHEMKTVEEFQGPKVMRRAAEWLEEKRVSGKFFLMVESFDPHEPWHLPEPYRSMYGEYDEKYTCWPPYQNAEASRRFRENATEEEIEFIRRQYAGNLTMTDEYLGKLFDVMDKRGLWDDTAVILTTDHGHELFERQRYGKAYPNWNLSANIPLIVWHPEYPGGGRRVDALSTAVDIYPTVLDILGAKDIEAVDGVSQMPVVRGEKQGVRDNVVYGIFSRGACLADGEYTYFSGYDNSKPLYWYSTHIRERGVGCEFDGVDVAGITSGRHIPGVEYPVWKVKCDAQGSFGEMLFRFDDREQANEISKTDPEGLRRCREKLKEIFKTEGVPEEQFERLGL